MADDANADDANTHDANTWRPPVDAFCVILHRGMSKLNDRDGTCAFCSLSPLAIRAFTATFDGLQGAQPLPASGERYKLQPMQQSCIHQSGQTTPSKCRGKLVILSVALFAPES